MRAPILLTALAALACGHARPGADPALEDPSATDSASTPATSTHGASAVDETPAGPETDAADPALDDLAGPSKAHPDAPPFELLVPPGPKDCWQPDDIKRVKWKFGNKINAYQPIGPYCDEALDEAIGENDLARIKALLKGAKKKRVDVNCQSAYGWAPLHSAAMAGHVEAARLLLKHGAAPNPCDMNAMTPLHYAVQDGKLEVALLLLKSGANPNAVNMAGEKPLHLVFITAYDFEPVQRIAFGKKVVGALIEAGADVNAPDGRGQTPLHRAAEHDVLPVVRLLVEHGADARVADSNGKTPADVAYDDETKAYLQQAAGKK